MSVLKKNFGDSNKKILILGKGRIGRGVEYYLKKYNPSLRVLFSSAEKEVKKAHFLINCFPGDIGQKGLKLALKFKKDLIDVSDTDYSFYLKFKKQIEEKKIRVFPECGFSPGLTNLICGREVKENKTKEVEILAGTISPEKFFFPFTWCFEDLIYGQNIDATLIKNGKKIKVPLFDGHRKENIADIEAESYLAEGLSSLPQNLRVKNMQYRVLRPLGFFYFFQYIKKYGFLYKNNIDFTKKILETSSKDNLTVADVMIVGRKEKIIWKIKSFSKEKEKLNSMQKITSLFPAIIVGLLFENKIKDKGILPMEKIGKDENLFKEIIKKINREKISIKRHTFHNSENIFKKMYNQSYQ